MLKGAETVAPPATVTGPGTAATEGFVLVSVMVAPLGGAADVSVTVFPLVSLPPNTDAGEIVIAERAVLVRHPPQSGWLDELGRLKGGRAMGLGVARCAP
jgi:hypothetical protein